MAMWLILTQSVRSCDCYNLGQTTMEGSCSSRTVISWCSSEMGVGLVIRLVLLAMAKTRELM